MTDDTNTNTAPTDDPAIAIPAHIDLGRAGTVLTDLREQARARAGTGFTLDLAALSDNDLCALAIARELVRWCREQGIDCRPYRPPPAFAPTPGAADAPPPERGSLLEQIGARSVLVWRDLTHACGFAGMSAVAALECLRHPKRLRRKDVLLYMERCGVDALPVVGLICFLMGLILGFQAAVQLHRFGADVFVADLVSLSICKELGPLMVAMICTGRAGSAFAAEIGTMKVSEEVDALITMGLDPARFLVLPKVLALTLVMPLLTLFGNLAGIAGGTLVGVARLGIPMTVFLRECQRAVLPWDLGEGLVKSIVFGILVASAGCLRGMETEGGAQGVGTSTTSAVVTGILLVIVSDALLTIVFAQLGLGT